MFDRINVEIGAALPYSYEFNLEALVERNNGKGGHCLSRMLRTLADELHKSLKVRAAELE